jgi:hypothetical protein
MIARCTSVILATKEAEAEDFEMEASWNNLARPCLRTKFLEGIGTGRQFSGTALA